MTDTLAVVPPVARIEHKETTLHGVTLVDDYAWMRDVPIPIRRRGPRTSGIAAIKSRAKYPASLHILVPYERTRYRL